MYGTNIAVLVLGLYLVVFVYRRSTMPPFLMRFPIWKGSSAPGILVIYCSTNFGFCEGRGF